MSQIGNLGSCITFEVSGSKQLTFSGFKRTVSGRWTQHGGIGIKQASEFVGPGLDEGTFDITISAFHGVKPRDTIKVIENAIKTGQTNRLVIGGNVVGDNPYYILSMSETWNQVYNHGELAEATLSISIKEYA